ncbi:MAG: DUF4350 domain-containing protein [Gammaproteobacteria bacterium]|jgi:hypothetical protein|nr:DUF4350 domain-containing protein [Gammaproteobacteria bacterium]
MKDRLITLGSALAALILVIVLLAPPPAPPSKEVSIPTSTNSGRYGLLGLKRWLDASGVATMSLQSRYDTLFSDETITASGNLLITSAPALEPARDQELERLWYWLSQGNDVLLLSANSDAPQWSQSAQGSGNSSVLRQLGYQLLVESNDYTTEEEQQDAQEEPQTSLAEDLRRLGDQLEELKYQQITLTPLRAHPLTRDVNGISARTLPAVEPPTRLLGLDWPRNALVILRDADARAAMWEARVGQGRLWVSRFADLFGNVSLGQQDNARLMANIIRSSIQPGGKVIFDDMHFGVTNLYNPEAFFGDSRLHNTLWFILGFWLLYVVGYANRFMPVNNKRPKVQNVDFACAVGGYFARRLMPKSAAMALFEHFFNDVRAYYQKPLNGEPVWDLLERNPRITPKSITQLQGIYFALERKKRFNLVKLRNQLNYVRKQITVRNQITL